MCIPVLHRDLGTFPWVFEATLCDARDTDAARAKASSATSSQDSAEFNQLVEKQKDLQSKTDEHSAAADQAANKQYQLQWLGTHQQTLQLTDENAMHVA